MIGCRSSSGISAERAELCVRLDLLAALSTEHSRRSCGLNRRSGSNRLNKRSGFSGNRLGSRGRYRLGYGSRLGYRLRCRSGRRYRLRHGSRRWYRSGCRLRSRNRLGCRDGLGSRLLIALILLRLLNRLLVLRLNRLRLDQRLILLRLFSGVVVGVKTRVLANCKHALISYSEDYITNNSVLNEAVDTGIAVHDPLTNAHEHQIERDSIISYLDHCQRQETSAVSVLRELTGVSRLCLRAKHEHVQNDRDSDRYESSNNQNKEVCKDRAVDRAHDIIVHLCYLFLSIFQSCENAFTGIMLL